MSLTELLDENAILVNLKATQKQEVIEELAAALTESGRISDNREVLQAVLEREKIMSTGIGKGVAIPHGKCKAVDRLVGVLGIKKEGVDFQSLDEQPVYLFFLLVSPLNVSGPHIRALAHISRLLRHDNLRKQLIAAEDPRDALALIAEEEENM
ncbi:MAG: PTS sugar transporter subunit IIA [Gemmatimonadetes bacterium]|nr:PTS sugar transporter subunit IIA [Gemmatimonadota bacterium]MYA78325.1 PTS sugar transporter subunit IIA [Gemmatimonadota bacterium]MYG17030.1 PTS sugar transporter subunit IIA [Gemmatimonadota bacterium]MYH18815.1 PTS sugar transporter subunit IIA [Gemmatimonadota bacterium]MYK99902.1 PTS sugar transporter subunit IIA [Gemmatimonadota bacterium]